MLSEERVMRRSKVFKVFKEVKGFKDFKGEDSQGIGRRERVRDSPGVRRRGIVIPLALTITSWLEVAGVVETAEEAVGPALEERLPPAEELVLAEVGAVMVKAVIWPSFQIASTS